ncbi:hypothetical protein C8R43DRAFT_949424 [Mycena crocata]|nr:hypothetical protein C8R43DRAFT_949424 [Mycena crocata]
MSRPWYHATTRSESPEPTSPLFSRSIALRNADFTSTSSNSSNSNRDRCSVVDDGPFSPDVRMTSLPGPSSIHGASQTDHNQHAPILYPGRLLTILATLIGSIYLINCSTSILTYPQTSNPGRPWNPTIAEATHEMLMHHHNLDHMDLFKAYQQTKTKLDTQTRAYSDLEIRYDTIQQVIPSLTLIVFTEIFRSAFSELTAAMSDKLAGGSGDILPTFKPLEPLDREDFPDVPYWTDKEYLDEFNHRKSAKGPNENENTQLWFLTTEDGTPVTGAYGKDVGAHARSIWVFLYRKGLAPPTWGEAPSNVLGYFARGMETKYTEFRLCEHSCKALRLAKLIYSGWRGDYFTKYGDPKARKNEPNKAPDMQTLGTHTALEAPTDEHQKKKRKKTKQASLDDVSSATEESTHTSIPVESPSEMTLLLMAPAAAFVPPADAMAADAPAVPAPIESPAESTPTPSATPAAGIVDPADTMAVDVPAAPAAVAVSIPIKSPAETMPPLLPLTTNAGSLSTTPAAAADTMDVHTPVAPAPKPLPVPESLGLPSGLTARAEFVEVKPIKKVKKTKQVNAVASSSGTANIDKPKYIRPGSSTTPRTLSLLRVIDIPESHSRKWHNGEACGEGSATISWACLQAQRTISLVIAIVSSRIVLHESGGREWPGAQGTRQQRVPGTSIAVKSREAPRRIVEHGPQRTSLYLNWHCCDSMYLIMTHLFRRQNELLAEK